MLDTSVKVFNIQSLYEVNEILPHKHLPVVFGVICATLNIDLYAASHALLFTTLRTILASAVRLDIVGPIEVCILSVFHEFHCRFYCSTPSS